MVGGALLRVEGDLPTQNFPVWPAHPQRRVTNVRWENRSKWSDGKYPPVTLYTQTFI